MPQKSQHVWQIGNLQNRQLCNPKLPPPTWRVSDCSRAPMTWQSVTGGKRFWDKHISELWTQTSLARTSSNEACCRSNLEAVVALISSMQRSCHHHPYHLDDQANIMPSVIVEHAKRNFQLFRPHKSCQTFKQHKPFHTFKVQKRFLPAH